MMKKIIALALALSMALSMVAFAGYTDAALINTDLTGAIDLVGALGIMTGNPDGSFNPKGTLTRGEAAVIAYRLSAGKKDIDASWGDASLNNFTDMAGHWSAPYVNYCAALGLILGDPAGTFRPNDAVTAVEMAKMLLNAAGYDTEKQGYGKNWPAAVLGDATNSGLFTDFEAAYTAAASREWVAKLVANLILKVQTVSYSQLTGGLVKNTVGNTTTPSLFGSEKYGVKSVDVFALANEKAGILAASDEDYSKVGATITTGEDADVVIKYVIPTELLGHKVKVFYKTGDTDALADAAKIYAVVDAAETVIETAMDKIYVDTSSDSTGGLCVNGKVVDADVTATTGVKYYENLVVKSTAPIKANSSSSYNNDGRAVELVYQDDAWYAFYNAVTYTKVTENDAENTTFETTAVDGPWETTDEDEYAAIIFNDEVAEDDYVAIEKLKDNTYSVSKLTALTTKVDSASTSTSTTFKVGSTTYKKAATVADSFNWTRFFETLTEENLENETFDIYAVGNYVVFAKTTDDTVSGFNMNLAYLIDTKAASGTGAFATAAQVQVMLTDGSIAIYEYDPATGDVAFDALDEKHLYNYRLNADGTIAMTTLASAAANDDGVVEDPSNASYVKGETLAKSYVSTSAGVAYANADSFLFVEYVDAVSNKTKHAVVKASELKGDMDSDYTIRTLATAADEETGLTSLVYALVVTSNDLPTADAEDQDYFLATANATKVVSGGKTVWTVKGINAQGAVETLTLTSDPGTTKGKIYMVSANDEVCTLVGLSNVSSSSDIEKGKWNKVVVTASTDSSVMLNKPVVSTTTASGASNTTVSSITAGTGNANGLFDLADDAVITYVYGTTLKTADLAAKAPFQALITTTTAAEVNKTVSKTLTGASAATNVTVMLKGDVEIYKDNAIYRAVTDGAQVAVSESDTLTNAKVTIQKDTNAYVYVLLNAEGEVTDMIISVESKTDNTPNSVADDFSFVVAAPARQ